jgi:hypothetical protein
MTFARLACVSLLGCAVSASPLALAHAAEAGDVATPTSDPWRKGSSTAALNLGAGSAVGLAGLTYSYLPLAGFESEVGIGIGITGVQLSAMQKLVLGQGRTRFVAGLGFAYSPGGSLSHDWARELWLNFDLLGLEVRAKNHFVFFLSVGLTLVLGESIVVMGDPMDCGTPPCQIGDDLFPQLRIGLGRSF